MEKRILLQIKPDTTKSIAALNTPCSTPILDNELIAQFVKHSGPSYNAADMSRIMGNGVTGITHIIHAHRVRPNKTQKLARRDSLRENKEEAWNKICFVQHVTTHVIRLHLV